MPLSRPSLSSGAAGRITTRPDASGGNGTREIVRQTPLLRKTKTCPSRKAEMPRHRCTPSPPLSREGPFPHRRPFRLFLVCRAKGDILVDLTLAASQLEFNRLNA